MKRLLPFVVLALALVAAALWLFSRRAMPPEEAAAAAAPVLEEIAVDAPAGTAASFIRPELREALGLEGESPGARRLDLIRSVGGSLVREEADALLHEILRPRDPSVHQGWHSEYFHEICLLLRSQIPDRARFARALATVAADARRDEVERDYATQHLRQVWERSADLPDLRPSIEETFQQLAVSGDPRLGPSALLSLHLLGAFPSEEATPSPDLPPGLSATAPARFHVADDRLEKIVVPILTADPSAPAIALRMTALRVVSERRLTAYKAVVAGIAADGEGREHAVVRMAAIAVLGRIGEAADRPLLESLDASDPRIETAVRDAVARLR